MSGPRLPIETLPLEIMLSVCSNLALRDLLRLGMLCS